MSGEQEVAPGAVPEAHEWTPEPTEAVDQVTGGRRPYAPGPPAPERSLLDTWEVRKPTAVVDPRTGDVISGSLRGEG